MEIVRERAGPSVLQLTPRSFFISVLIVRVAPRTAHQKLRETNTEQAGRAHRGPSWSWPCAKPKAQGPSSSNGMWSTPTYPCPSSAHRQPRPSFEVCESGLLEGADHLLAKEVL